MATLLDLNTQSQWFLAAHHSFGRLPSAVNSVVAGDKISKFHTLIEWQQGQWMIRDFSRNGTWLNGVKLNQNQQYPLQLNDKIALACAENILFEVLDLTAPGDALVLFDEQQQTIISAIQLDQYNLLPDEQDPEVVLFNDSTTDQWFLERLNKGNPQSTQVDDDAIIEFSGQTWQLKLGDCAQQTELQVASIYPINQLQFVFNVTLDEEQTQLAIYTPDQTFDMLVRCHHYLTLLLARVRAEDARNGLDKSLQGWVYPEQLCRDLGIDISHLNIQVHRARKQLCDKLSIANNQPIIERQAGKLRFAGCQFKIVKGGQIECDLAG